MIFRLGKQFIVMFGNGVFMDSHSVKSTSIADSLGYDGGKKVNGRKRHIKVDTLGLLMAVVVLTADIQDRDGANYLLRAIKGVFSKLKVILADGGYRGEVKDNHG